jgi:hypothetical protein
VRFDSLFSMTKVHINRKATGREITEAVVGSFNCIGDYEVPGQTLEHRGEPGMHLYSGCITGAGPHRIRIYVPTDVYGRKAAQILAYEPATLNCEVPTEPEKLVALTRVSLRSMPRWDAPLQTLLLSRRDERNVIRAVNELEEKLSEG